VNPPSVLFVCLGNICRSPLAEGILLRQAAGAGVEIVVDSAGTGSWHVGHPADPRSQSEGRRRGCEMLMRARQFVAPDDFERFDLIVPMDRMNLRELSRLPGFDPERVRLARLFDPNAAGDEVPDPYLGEERDFVAVGEMLEPVCRGILAAVDGRR
jgi:protein-tyrosine phosphatase